MASHQPPSVGLASKSFVHGSALNKRVEVFPSNVDDESKSYAE